MVTEKTLLCIKEIQKGNLISNFRATTSLPLSWKLLPGILPEELYEHLQKTNSLPWDKSDAGKEAEASKINY